MTATETVREAAHSTTMRRLARLGLAARGAIYLLVGVLAVLLALGKKNSETDQRGALQETTQHTGGTFLVWVIAIGLACYALWRFSEAAFGVVGEGNKAGPRLQSFVRGCIYAFLAIGAFKLLLNSGGSSQAKQQETITAKIMQHNGGRWAVGIVGVIIVIVGLVLVWQGLRHQFEKYLDLGAMSYEDAPSRASHWHDRHRGSWHRLRPRRHLRGAGGTRLRPEEGERPRRCAAHPARYVRRAVAADPGSRRSHPVRDLRIRRGPLAPNMRHPTKAPHEIAGRFRVDPAGTPLRAFAGTPKVDQ